MTGPGSVAILQTAIVIAILIVASLYVTGPDDPITVETQDVVDDPPISDPPDPVDEPPDPGDNSTDPGDNSTNPGDNSTNPGDNSTNPGDNSTNPGDNSTNPGDNSTNPGDNSTNPGDNSTNPGDNSTNPGDNSTNPGDNSTNPGDNSTNPGDNSTNPGDNSTNPGDNSTNPGDNSTDPGDNSTDPPEPFWPSKGTIGISGTGTFEFDPNEVVTVRPDIFRENHFSLFDVLVHLDDRGDIEMEYHFDEALNTHVIDTINGYKNWWYWAYYHSGWQEANNFRMDHYPYKDQMTIQVQREDSSRIDRIHQVFRDEVKRIEANDGKVIIPKVIIRGRTHTLTFKDVEVTAHNLRNDTFQDGVITAIDVILSLADQGEITYKLTWYDRIGRAVVTNYFVDGINEDQAYGTCGFVYEAGSEKLRYGNHIHIPSDYRIINSPEYEEWFWICL